MSPCAEELLMQKWFWTLWPSFLTACIGEGLFFSFIDPQNLYFLGEPVHYAPLASYTVGFFCLWGLCAISSLLTYLLLRPRAEINQAGQ
jgi:hypothetical protein